VANHGIVIDVSRLKFTKFHTDSVTIGTGMRNFEIYQTLWNEGRYAFTGGTCPTVASSGFTLGGGFGYIQRRFGLAVDNLLSVDLINSNAELITANATNSHADLFWALRGGGNGNFGVVVSMTFRLIKAPNFVVKYDVSWRGRENMYEAYEMWQDYVSTFADTRLTSQFTIFNGSFASQGLFLGSEEELREILKPLIRVSPSTMNGNGVKFKVFSYFDSVLEYAQCDNVTVCEKIMTEEPSPEHPILYKTKSAYAFHKITPKGLETLSQILSDPMPYPQLTSDGFFACVQFDSYGGAIGDVEPEETAFPHRKALFHAQYMIYYNERGDRDHAEQWIRNWYQQTVGFLSEHAYANYVDADLKDFEWSYYGVNVDRLRQIKRRYDPGNLFRYEQSIRP